MPKRQRTHKGATSDRAEARVYGKFGSAYRHLLGQTPRLKTGDREAAGLFLGKIEQAIDRGGWTPAEADRLYRLRKKWRARARGEDARFNTIGNRPGPGPEEQERESPEVRKVKSTLKEVNKLLWGETRKIQARRMERSEDQREGEGE